TVAGEVPVTKPLFDHRRVRRQGQRNFDLKSLESPVPVRDLLRGKVVRLARTGAARSFIGGLGRLYQRRFPPPDLQFDSANSRFAVDQILRIRSRQWASEAARFCHPRRVIIARRISRLASAFLSASRLSCSFLPRPTAIFTFTFPRRKYIPSGT